MPHTLPDLRRRFLGFAPWAALVLVLGFLAGAVPHHHEDDAPQHDHCAVCHVSHAKAVPAGETIVPGRPTPTGARLALAPVDAPPAAVAAIARGRAPPALG